MSALLLICQYSKAKETVKDTIPYDDGNQQKQKSKSVEPLYCRRAHDTLNDELLIRRYESRIAVDDHKNATTFGSFVKELKPREANTP